MDIFSKKSEPYREDVAAKRMIADNRATIHKLADTLSNGAFSAKRRAEAAQKAASTEPPRPSKFHLLGTQSIQPKQEPRLKASLNGRVVIFDASRGTQLHFLGQFKYADGQKYFCLALEENGFVSPLAPEVAEALKVLDGVVIEDKATEEKLLDFIRRTLHVK